MKLQFFAGDDGGDEGGDGGDTGDDGKEGDDTGGSDKKPEITPEMQAVIDSVIGKEKAKLKAKLEADKEEELSRAKELAAMSEKERKEAEEADRIKELEERERAVEQKEYRMEAIRQLEAVRLSAGLAGIVLADNPETTAENIKALRKQIDAEVEAEVKKRLAGKSPAGGTGAATTGRGEAMAKAMNSQTKPGGKDPWGKQ